MRILAIVATVLLTCGTGAGEETLNLSKMSDWTVVVAPDAIPSEQYVAEEFRGLVKQAVGIDLPIAKQPPRPNKNVFIGAGEAMRSSSVGFGVESLGDEGLRIQIKQENIAIAGGRPRGTLYGVYEFMERYLGVRWLMPGADGEDVPEHTTIDVPTAEVRQEPVFVSRHICGLYGKAPLWARRNRSRLYNRVEFHHNLVNLFPADKYTKTHPHFYPLRGGKRYLPASNTDQNWQPCFTAKGLAEEAVKNICEYFENNPEATSYSLGVNDTWSYCECAECLSRDSGRNNFLGQLDKSDVYFEWCNKVVSGVLERYPDKWFGCLAYSRLTDAPTRVEVHRRIVPYMTYGRMKWIDPAIRAEGERLAKSWLKACATVGWYDYIYGAAYCVPRVWFHHMADYCRTGRELGVRAMYAEAYPFWGEGPKLYVSMKLQWDPSQGVDELLRDWYTRAVGSEAAGDLAAYYAHWEDFWTRRILKSEWFTRGGQFLNFADPSYLVDVTGEDMALSRRLMEEVVAKAESSKQQARATVLMTGFEYYEATVMAYQADAAAHSLTVENEADALKLLDNVERCLTMVRKREKLVSEDFPRHPDALQSAFFAANLKRMPKVSGDSWGDKLLWRVQDFAQASDSLVRKRLKEMTGSGLDKLSAQAQAVLDKTEEVGGVGYAAGTIRIVHNGKALLLDMGSNLLSYPSFEHQDKADAANPWPWGLWAKPGTSGRMSISSVAARTGAAGVMCQGVKEGCPWRFVPFTEPGRYAAVAFVRVPREPTGNASIKLWIQLLNDSGILLRNSPATVIRAKACDWTPVVAAGNLPARVGEDNVKQLRLTVTASGFEPGDEIHIDDIALFRLEE